MHGAYYKSLDGLRAIAVLIVMAAHSGLPYPLSGGIGVDIFFVLSGFLITTILSTEAEQFGRINLRNFYIRRFLRLAPALVFTIVFFALAYHAVYGTFPVRQVIIAGTYAANWAEALYATDLSWIEHFWSLAIEEQYYLIWPWVILLLERSRLSRVDRGLILLALAMLVAVYRYVMVGHYSADRIYFGLDTHMDGLILGSALSYFLRPLSGGKFLPESQSRILGRIVAPAALLGLLVMMYFVTWQDAWMSRYGLLFAALASAALIADLVAGSKSLLRGVLETGPMVFIGKISYGLYLLHLPVFSLLAHVVPHGRISSTSGMVLFGLKLAASLAAAVLSFYLVERPFLRLKRLFEPESRSSAKEVLRESSRA